MPSQLSTKPDQVTMATSETLPLGFDATALLLEGQSVSDVSTVLVDLSTDSPVTLSDPPTVAGNVITQVVRGSDLNANQRYRLSVTFTAGTDTVRTMVLSLSVPQ